MPSGYTEYIGKGIAFSDWVMICARAMGATIMMRDDSLLDPIPVFEPSTYHEEKIDRLVLELHSARCRTDSEWETLRSAEEKRRKEENNKINLEKQILKGRYHSMLEDVRRWNPPTAEHEGLKKFMEKQIVDSIEWDCGIYEEDSLPEDYKESEINQILEQLSWHSNEYAEERNRTAERNKWVKELRDSLP